MRQATADTAAIQQFVQGDPAPLSPFQFSQKLASLLGQHNIHTKIELAHTGPYIFSIRVHTRSQEDLHNIETLAQDLTETFFGHETGVICRRNHRGAFLEIPMRGDFPESLVSGAWSLNVPGATSIALGYDVNGHPLTICVSNASPLVIAGGDEKTTTLTANSIASSVISVQTQSQCQQIQIFSVTVGSNSNPSTQTGFDGWAGIDILERELVTRARLLQLTGAKNYVEYNVLIAEQFNRENDGRAIESGAHEISPLVVTILQIENFFLQNCGRIQRVLQLLKDLGGSAGVFLVSTITNSFDDQAINSWIQSCSTKAVLQIKSRTDFSGALKTIKPSQLLPSDDAFVQPPNSKGYLRVSTLGRLDGHCDLKPFRPTQQPDVLLPIDDFNKQYHSSNQQTPLFGNAYTQSILGNSSFENLRRILKRFNGMPKRFLGLNRASSSVIGSDHKGINFLEFVGFLSLFATIFALYAVISDIVNRGEVKQIEALRQSASYLPYTPIGEPSSFDYSLSDFEAVRPLNSGHPMLVAWRLFGHAEDHQFYGLSSFSLSRLPIDLIEQRSASYDRQLKLLVDQLPQQLAREDVLVSLSALGIFVSTSSRAMATGLFQNLPDGASAAFVAYINRQFGEHLEDELAAQALLKDCTELQQSVSQIKTLKSQDPDRIELPDIFYLLSLMSEGDYSTCSLGAIKRRQALVQAFNYAREIEIVAYNGVGPTFEGLPFNPTRPTQYSAVMATDKFLELRKLSLNDQCKQETKDVEMYLRGIFHFRSLRFEEAIKCFELMSFSKSDMVISIGSNMLARSLFWRNRLFYGDYRPGVESETYEDEGGGEIAQADPVAVQQAEMQQRPFPCDALSPVLEGKGSILNVVSVVRTCQTNLTKLGSISKAQMERENSTTLARLIVLKGWIAARQLISTHDVERYQGILAAEMQ